ncbi:MAG: hypothetical protein ACREV9_05945 [Burkholderiales bacterium]
MNSGDKNLENLVRAKLLKAEPTSKQEIASLLASAEEQLRDSHTASLKPTSRFMLAYNAVHALALTALRAQGYRPSTAPGHRRVVFQVLEVTADAEPQLWRALDRYHDRRNATEYEGAPSATEAEAEDIVKLAGKLQRLVLTGLKRAHPELL